MSVPLLPGSLSERVVEWHCLDWYAAPLYYDIVFEEETECEAAWLDELFTLFGPLLEPSEAHITVLEPACGSGRLMHALRLRHYRCIGFDCQAAAVDFARNKCEAAALCTASSSLSTASNSSSPRPLPPYYVFEASLTNFVSVAPRLLLPAGSVHVAHCLVSSLKYLRSDDELMEHFNAVAAALVDGGLYVIALHLSDYTDSSASVDEHTAERDGVRVAMTITCEPPNRDSRTEQVSIRMLVTTSDERHSHSANYRWEETMRTYDRVEVWQLLSGVSHTAGWFDVVAIFDYEQARHGRVEMPLEWPQPLQSFDAALSLNDISMMDWTRWKGVEALAVVLRRKEIIRR